MMADTLNLTLKKNYIHDTGDNMTESDYQLIEIISKFVEKYDTENKNFHLKTLLNPYKYLRKK